VNVVGAKLFNVDKEALAMGEPYRFEVTVDVGSLKPEDIGVEIIMASITNNGKDIKVLSKRELSLEKSDGHIAVYSVEALPSRTGYYDMATRIFPKNAALPHRMDFALVKWA